MIMINGEEEKFLFLLFTCTIHTGATGKYKTVMNGGCKAVTMEWCQSSTGDGQLIMTML